MKMEINYEETCNLLYGDINLKLIPTKIIHYVWQVNFRYKTINGEKEEDYRYTIADNGTDARKNFLSYIREFNENNEDCKLLNVKIISITDIGNIEQCF